MASTKTSTHKHSQSCHENTDRHPVGGAANDTTLAHLCTLFGTEHFLHGEAGEWVEQKVPNKGDKKEGQAAQEHALQATLSKDFLI